MNNLKKITVIFVIISLIIFILLSLVMCGQSHNMIIPDDKVCHFSIDDTILVFDDITKHAEYKTIFENSTLGFLRELHNKYDIKVTMYVFHHFAGISLDECTDRFKNEFIANKDWLIFRFHANDDNLYKNCDTDFLIKAYRSTDFQIKRITGSNFQAKAIRLDRFSGDSAYLSALNYEFGIKAYLTADDDRLSYYLNADGQDILLQHDILKQDNIVFTPSDIRLENFLSKSEIRNEFNRHTGENNLVIFTHERILEDKKIKEILEYIIKLAKKQGYQFSDYLYIDRETKKSEQ